MFTAVYWGSRNTHRMEAAKLTHDEMVSKCAPNHCKEHATKQVKLGTHRSKQFSTNVAASHCIHALPLCAARPSAYMHRRDACRMSTAILRQLDKTHAHNTLQLQPSQACTAQSATHAVLAPPSHGEPNRATGGHERQQFAGLLLP